MIEKPDIKKPGRQEHRMNRVREYRKEWTRVQDQHPNHHKELQSQIADSKAVSLALTGHPKQAKRDASNSTIYLKKQRAKKPPSKIKDQVSQLQPL